MEHVIVGTRSRSGILVDVATAVGAFGAAVMMSAAIACAPPANAMPITRDWSGDSPTGGMIVYGRLPVHAEAHTADSNDHMHMTAANGCVEDWYYLPGGGTTNGVVNGFFEIRVVSGEGTGCVSTSPVSVNIQDMGGGNAEMTVTQTPNVASWVLHGHG
jgi:hypothetical protein